MNRTRKFSFLKLSAEELLTYSFVLCMSPVFLDWFGLGAPRGRPQEAVWSGLAVMGPLYYLSLALYLWAVWGKRGRRLGLGVLAHILLAVSYGWGFYNFPIAANIGGHVNPDLSRLAVQPAFWLGAAALALHLLFFLAVELKSRRRGKGGGAPER